MFNNYVNKISDFIQKTDIIDLDKQYINAYLSLLYWLNEIKAHKKNEKFYVPYNIARNFFLLTDNTKKKRKIYFSIPLILKNIFLTLKIEGIFFNANTKQIEIHFAEKKISYNESICLEKIIIALGVDSAELLVSVSKHDKIYCITHEVNENKEIIFNTNNILFGKSINN